MAMQIALLEFGAEVLLPMMLLIGEQAWCWFAFLYRQERSSIIASFLVLDFDSMCMARKLMGKKIGLVQQPLPAKDELHAHVP